MSEPVPTRVTYQVKYTPIDPNDKEIRPGLAGKLLAEDLGDPARDPFKAAQSCLKYFNSKTTASKVNGKEVKKTTYKDRVTCWVEEYHDGELHKKYPPEKLIRPDNAPVAGGEGSFLKLLQEALVEEGHFDAEAAELVQKHSAIVVRKMMAGWGLKSIREAVTEIEAAEGNVAIPAKQAAASVEDELADLERPDFDEPLPEKDDIPALSAKG